MLTCLPNVTCPAFSRLPMYSETDHRTKRHISNDIFKQFSEAIKIAMSLYLHD